MQSKIQRLGLLACLAVFGAILLYKASATPPHSTLAPVAEPALKRVKVATVETGESSRELRFSGVTRAAKRARLAFSIGGRMEARPIDIGDHVQAGQVLAHLDDLELHNAVASAQATVAELKARRVQTERDRERTKQLAAAKAATDEELERTAAAADALLAAEAAAAARLREAQRRLTEAQLKAPFSGTVTEVLREPGEYVSSGTPVLMLAGAGDIEVELEVPESVISLVAIGDKAHVTLPVIGSQAVEGRVNSVGRAAAGPGRLFPIVIELPEGDPVVAGMTAEIHLRLDSQDALMLPVEAVINPGGQRPAVFRLMDASGGDQVEKIAVEVGALVGDKVTVRGRLTAGDRVVVGGQRGLLDGESVEVYR